MDIGKAILKFGNVVMRRFLDKKQKGITLLLVILVLSSLLSISLGIFNAVFSELRISGEIADSFVALYAADEGVEHGLYLDRNGSTPLCHNNPGANCYVETESLANGSCYTIRVDKIPTADPNTFNVSVRATGEFRCGGGLLSVKRALRTDYTGP